MIGDAILSRPDINWVWSFFSFFFGSHNGSRRELRDRTSIDWQWAQRERAVERAGKTKKKKRKIEIKRNEEKETINRVEVVDELDQLSTRVLESRGNSSRWADEMVVRCLIYDVVVSAENKEPPSGTTSRPQAIQNEKIKFQRFREIRPCSDVFGHTWDLILKKREHNQFQWIRLLLTDSKEISQKDPPKKVGVAISATLLAGYLGSERAIKSKRIRKVGNRWWNRGGGGRKVSRGRHCGGGHQPRLANGRSALTKRADDANRVIDRRHQRILRSRGSSLKLRELQSGGL